MFLPLQCTLCSVLHLCICDMRYEHLKIFKIFFRRGKILDCSNKRYKLMLSKSLIILRNDQKRQVAIESHLFTSTRILQRTWGWLGNGILSAATKTHWRVGDGRRMFVTSDIWTLEMIARSLLLLITSRHSNLSICTLLNKSDQLSCVPVLEKNDRLLIIVLYICVQYIILLNRHATFHRIDQCGHCRMCTGCHCNVPRKIFSTSEYNFHWHFYVLNRHF